MPQNDHPDFERRDVEDTMPVPRFNQEAARQARQVMLLPVAAGAQLRRRFKVNPFLPFTLIAGAAVIGAVTGSIIWRYRQTGAAPTPAATLSQPNSPAKPEERESTAPETPPQSVVNSDTLIAEKVTDVQSDEVKLRKISEGVPAPRPVGTSVTKVAMPGEASRRAPSHPVAQAKPRQQEARSRRPAESVAAVGAVRRRTIEPANKERQPDDDEQKNKHREKNERHEAPLPTLPQDAGAIGRVRDVFEGQPHKRTTANRNVDRVTAIFTGRQQ